MFEHKTDAFELAGSDCRGVIMKNNKLISALESVAALFFIGLTVAFSFLVGSIVFSLILAAVVSGILALIVYGCITFWKKVDKKKFTIYSIIIGTSVIGILIAIGIANACIPTLSQEEVKAMVISELDSQIEKVKSEIGISELSVELEIDEYEYEKPTIFSKGHIRFEVDDYYVSSQFTELDNGEYNKKTCEKYLKIKSLEYDDVEIPKYRVQIRRTPLSDTEFKDSSGDEYSFDDDVIYKNGKYAYGKKSYIEKSFGSSSSSSSHKATSTVGVECDVCDGSGYVRYNSGMHDEGTLGLCQSCQGDGRH